MTVIFSDRTARWTGTHKRSFPNLLTTEAVVRIGDVGRLAVVRDKTLETQEPSGDPVVDAVDLEELVATELAVLADDHGEGNEKQENAIFEHIGHLVY